MTRHSTRCGGGVNLAVAECPLVQQGVLGAESARGTGLPPPTVTDNPERVAGSPAVRPWPFGNLVPEGSGDLWVGAIVSAFSAGPRHMLIPRRPGRP
jgi:hypothetical protein